MKAMMNYKNYIAKVEFDDEAELFHGEVINTRDVITFQGKSVNELKKALAESVEDYLAFCKERNEEPDRPFSGKFNLRLDPSVHRDAFLTAKQSGKSLNDWVTESICDSLTRIFRKEIANIKLKSKVVTTRVSHGRKKLAPKTQIERKISANKVSANKSYARSMKTKKS